MAKQRESSFRKILVSRILVLSVPVLLTGEFVAFRKARNSMLETAQKNLTESAFFKAEKIVDTVATLKSNLYSASQTTVVRSGKPEEIQVFIDNLAVSQRKLIECIQVVDLQTGQPVASTCGDDAIANMEFSNSAVVKLEDIQSQVVVPPKVVTNSLAEDGIPTQNKLQMIFSAPVQNLEGMVNYALHIRAQIEHRFQQSENTLTGYTLVIADDGEILLHPGSELEGKHISQHADADRLGKIVNNAIAQKQVRSPQFFTDEENQELIVGYSIIPSPITNNSPQKWIVLDVTSLDRALYGLKGIKLILILLTIGLIAASVIASFYLARHVSQPLEELCDYASQIGSKPQKPTKSDNFYIREFNQLARAFDEMTRKLNAWAEEIESAWKDAKSANQLKSHFLATTSHEIRNPLNIIINSIRIVKDDLCDSREEELEFLNRADETAIHLLNIINDLLDISKIEAGKLSVNLEVADLRDIIKETINLQSVNIQSKGLQFNVPQLEEELMVKVDRGKFKQVLINIIGNATKFTDRGSITLAVTTKSIGETQQPRYQVLIAIQDTGIGIEPAQQKNLFRPFVRVEDASHGRFQGTGLGLAISRNLIEMMGGKITIFSAGSNQGTTVNITLPLLSEELLDLNSQAYNESPINGLSASEYLVSMAEPTSRD